MNANTILLKEVDCDHIHGRHLQSLLCPVYSSLKLYSRFNSYTIYIVTSLTIHAKLFQSVFKQPYNLSIFDPFADHHPTYTLPKKFLSLILALRCRLIAFLISSLLSSASMAPLKFPSSFAGRSIDCAVMGIFGANASVFPDKTSCSSSLRWRLAARRRDFFDLAGKSVSHCLCALI